MCWKETFNFSSWMKANPCKWSYIYHAAHQSAAADAIHQSKLLLHKLSTKDNGINLVCWIPKCEKTPALLFHPGAYRSETTIMPDVTNRSYPCNTSRPPPRVYPSLILKACEELRKRSRELLCDSHFRKVNCPAPHWLGMRLRKVLLLGGQQVLKVMGQAGRGPTHPTHTHCWRPVTVSAVAHNYMNWTWCWPERCLAPTDRQTPHSAREGLDG